MKFPTVLERRLSDFNLHYLCIYRMIDDCERIKDGDQYYNGEKWFPTYRMNDIFTRENSMYIMRRLKVDFFNF